MNPICHPVASTISGGNGLSVRLQLALGTCACAGASAFLFAVDPNRHAVYPSCIFHRATGLYCAGCGSTRARYAVLHGRVGQAVHDNALFVAVLPLLGLLVGSYAWESWRRNAWPQVHLEPRPLLQGGFWIFLTMLLFMVVRNLPGSSFDFLRPLGG
jgi:hypothetical protein